MSHINEPNRKYTINVAEATTPTPAELPTPRELPVGTLFTSFTGPCHSVMLRTEDGCVRVACRKLDGPSTSHRPFAQGSWPAVVSGPYFKSWCDRPARSILGTLDLSNLGDVDPYTLGDTPRHHLPPPVPWAGRDGCQGGGPLPRRQGLHL